MGNRRENLAGIEKTIAFGFVLASDIDGDIVERFEARRNIGAKYCILGEEVVGALARTFVLNVEDFGDEFFCRRTNGIDIVIEQASAVDGNGAMRHVVVELYGIGSRVRLCQAKSAKSVAHVSSSASRVNSPRSANQNDKKVDIVSALHSSIGA